MTKLGTPIGAGPKGGDGRRRVGVGRRAALVELRAAVGAFGRGLIAGGRAGRASRRRCSRPAAEALVALDAAAGFVAGFRGVRGRAALDLAAGPRFSFGRRRRRFGGACVSASASSVVSEADSQSGSSRSTRPSPSSSTPLAQAGGWAEGRAEVVVSPLAAWLSPRPVDGSAPAMPTPSAVTTAKPARAMISASFCLIRSAPLFPACTSMSLPASTLSPSIEHAHATDWRGGAQRSAAPPNMPLINGWPMPEVRQHFKPLGWAR